MESAAHLPAPETILPYPVVADIAFAEGPIFDQHGNLYFVNYLALGTMGRRTPDGAVSVWVHTGGQPNGSKVDSWGNVVIADYGAKRISRIHPVTRRIEILTDEFEGKPYLGPNDVCHDAQGNIFFSDPTGSSRERPIGSIYRLAIGDDARVEGVTLLDTDLAFPNGLAVSPDQTKLYVAESSTNRLLGYDLHDDGTVSNRKVVMEFPSDTLDGMMFDAHGRLWIARWTNGTVDVVDVERGVLLASYPAGGDQVTNLCWWQESLYVTVAGRHSIHRLDVGVRGAEIIPSRSSV